MDKIIKFRTLNGKPLTATIRNIEKKTLGAVAKSAAERLHLAGAFECLDPRSSEVISPESPLADLPDTEEIVLASELTPA